MTEVVARKYNNFKEEILLNQIAAIGEYQWNIYIEKASVHITTDKVMQIYCPRRESASYYEMKYGQGMSIEHLVAMMVYCNNDLLQFKFSQTFRKLTSNESVESIKQRHRNYYWFGRLLRENVEAFGMEWRTTTYIRAFHGVNQHFTFSTMLAYIRGAFSITTDYVVACNFCDNKGMILELKIDPNQWRLKIDEGQEAVMR
eukprot:530387_1